MSRDNDTGKIFVGGLHPDTNADNMKKFFDKYGNVTDCVIKKDPVTQRSRGFGFVTFEDPSCVNSVLNGGPHLLDGKQIDPKPAVQKGQPAPQAGPSNLNTNKVFIGGVAQNTTEDEIKKYFSSYGQVKNVQLMYDKTTKRMRGFGFVTFDNDETVKKTCSVHFHNINGKSVEVKLAEDRSANRGVPGSQSNMYGGGNFPNMQFTSQYGPYANSGGMLGSYGYGSYGYGGNYAVPGYPFGYDQTMGTNYGQDGSSYGPGKSSYSNMSSGVSQSGTSSYTSAPSTGYSGMNSAGPSDSFRSVPNYNNMQSYM